MLRVDCLGLRVVRAAGNVRTSEFKRYGEVCENLAKRNLVKNPPTSELNRVEFLSNFTNFGNCWQFLAIFYHNLQTVS